MKWNHKYDPKMKNAEENNTIMVLMEFWIVII